MDNKRVIRLCGILCLMVFFIVSCSNLPGKENKNTGSTALPANNNDQQTLSEDPSEEILLQRNMPVEWSEPSSDMPTVTPIILEVEKRGEQAPIIVRETIPPASGDNMFSGQIINNSEQIISTPVPNYTQMNSQPAGMVDEMEVYSFNPRDGATVLPGQSLHLDVSLQNKGTTTWQTSYKVTDISGTPMTVQREYTLPYAVAPGGTVLLSIYMAAPSQLGTYVATFEIKDSYGVSFGRFSYSLTVGDFSVLTSIPTLTATITPTYYSPSGITATPDSLAWMCIDPERSKLQDCYSFCVEYSHRPEFRYCYYNGELYLTPVP